MKNKTFLLLAEQLIMVLVFAVAAALCLSAFVKADRISQETIRRDEAVLLAQNAAEMLKATGGNGEQALGMLHPETAEAGYRMEIQRLSSDYPLLGRAEIRIWLEEDLLFTLQTGWQEAAE